jgi:hypothetical protein
MKVTLGIMPVTNFSLALKETYKNGGGAKKTNTLWIREHIVRNPADYPKTSTVGTSYSSRNPLKQCEV